MPASYGTRRSLRLLVFSYVSAVSLILLFLVITQGLIQLSLMQSQQRRALSQQLNSQELRTERMFYNVLLLQNPPGHGVDYMAYYHLVLADEPAWEVTQQAMYTGNATLGIFPSNLSPAMTTALQKEKPDFLIMEAAYRHIFALEQRDHPASPDVARPDVNTIYIQEGPYLQSLITIYSQVAAQADAQVAQVRTIEIILFVLSCLILLVEALLIVRPAIIQIRDLLKRVNQILEEAGKVSRPLEDPQSPAPSIHGTQFQRFKGSPRFPT